MTSNENKSAWLEEQKKLKSQLTSLLKSSKVEKETLEVEDIKDVKADTPGMESNTSLDNTHQSDDSNLPKQNFNTEDDTELKPGLREHFNEKFGLSNMEAKPNPETDPQTGIETPNQEPNTKDTNSNESIEPVYNNNIQNETEQSTTVEGSNEDLNYTQVQDNSDSEQNSESQSNGYDPTLGKQPIFEPKVQDNITIKNENTTEPQSSYNQLPGQELSVIENSNIQSQNENLNNMQTIEGNAEEPEVNSTIQGQTEPVNASPIEPQSEYQSVSHSEPPSEPPSEPQDGSVALPQDFSQTEPANAPPTEPQAELPSELPSEPPFEPSSEPQDGSRATPLYNSQTEQEIGTTVISQEKSIALKTPEEPQTSEVLNTDIPPEILNESEKQSEKIEIMITQGSTILDKFPDYVNKQNEVEMLNNARRALDNNNLEQAAMLAEEGLKQINLIYNQLISALKILKITKVKIIEVRDQGVDVAMVTKVFDQAKNALKNNDFKNAVAYSNLCETLLKKNTQ